MIQQNIHFIQLPRSDIYFGRNISGIFNAKIRYRPLKMRFSDGLGVKQDNILYACYLAQGDINLVKKYYQKTNEFCFTCENGVYSFVIFVKDEKSNEVIYKRTESFKIENYQICVIAESDIKHILNEENKYLVSDCIDNISESCRYVLMDIAYILESKSSDYIVSLVRRVTNEGKFVFLLNNCFKGKLETNKKALQIIDECIWDKVAVIDSHQLLQKSDNNIIYEDFDAFKRVLLSGLETTIKKILRN